MAKPSIGEVVTSSAERLKRKDVKELEVLEKGAKESIYHLLFGTEQEKSEKTE